MVVIHVVVMRLGLGIKVSRICAVIRHVELARVVLIVGVLSGGVLVVVNLVLRELDRTSVHIVHRNFVIHIDFDHVVMVVVVRLVLLRVELRRKLLRRVRHAPLLMELDLVLGEQGVIDLKGHVGRSGAVLWIKSLEISVLDVARLALDLQLILILIVVVTAIGVALDEMRRLNILLAIHVVSVEICGLCNFLLNLKIKEKSFPREFTRKSTRNKPFSCEFLLSS